MLTNILEMIYNTSRALRKVFGVWLSLVEYLVWDQGAAGSNPVTPMKKWRFVTRGRFVCHTSLQYDRRNVPLS